MLHQAPGELAEVIQFLPRTGGGGRGLEEGHTRNPRPRFLSGGG